MPWSAQPLPLGSYDGKLTGRTWAGLALAALTVTVFVCVAEPSVFGTMDWVRLHGFYKPYIQASVARGRLPLWNPYVSLGRPLLAEPDSVFSTRPTSSTCSSTCTLRASWFARCTFFFASTAR